MLANGEMHPSFIQKAARHKRPESQVTYIESSLSKALKANNLLSGNNPSEGWGSKFLGNPKSLSRFLPEKLIKKLPPQAENALEWGNSTASSETSGSSLREDSSNQKNISDQDQFREKKVRFEETLPTTDAVSSVPSMPTVNLAALEALQRSSAIEVIYLKSLQSNNVSSQTQILEYPENKFPE